VAPAPVRLGLTGGIGAGKSAALAAFARRGVAVLSSDDIVHALYRDPEVVNAVVQRFGPDVLGPDGQVDRAVLGPRAFAADGGISFLEGLLHPRIGQWREAWMRDAAAAHPPPVAVVCEVPLLFEVGLQDEFDAVIVVTASEDVRRARVEARGQSFDERRSLQWDEPAKVAAADMAFVNDGDLHALDAFAGEVLARFATEGPRGEG
jgi:dephospho-CoA kinase